MKGFFGKNDFLLQGITKKGKPASCVSCGLGKTAKTKNMEPYGQFKKEIMLVGDIPCDYSDEKGKPWQGTDGRFLQNTLYKMGIDIFKDCVTINAINCAKPYDEAPTDHEMSCCLTKVREKIAKYNPKVIFLLGDIAVKQLIGDR